MVRQTGGALVRAGALALGVCAAALVAPSGEVTPAGACSCVGPHATLLSPDRVDDAPLNARVRLEIPRGATTTAVVRPVSGKVAVPVTSRAMPSGSVDIVELTPSAPLAPSTRYEIAVVMPTRHPSVHVLGTFKTGTAADTAPPRMANPVRASAFRNLHAGGGDCSIPGPWIELHGVAGTDPGRPSAQLLWGVWVADAAGKVDPTKPPVLLLRDWKGTVGVGRRSLCDVHDYPLPAGSFAFGLAAVDEAGNASALQRITVNIAAAGVRP